MSSLIGRYFLLRYQFGQFRNLVFYRIVGIKIVFDAKIHPVVKSGDELLVTLFEEPSVAFGEVGELAYHVPYFFDALVVEGGACVHKRYPLVVVGREEFEG